MEKECAVCGKGFKVIMSDIDKRKTCSRSCMAVQNKNLTGAKNPNWRGGKKMSKCKKCKKDFDPKKDFPLNLYCSLICCVNKKVEALEKARLQRIKQKREKRIQERSVFPKCRVHFLKCTVCSKYFATNNDSKRVCSVECKGKARKASNVKAGETQQHKIFVTCKICRKEFRVPKSKQERGGIYCGFECRKKDLIGVTNPNYIDGRTPVNSKIRASDEYKQWRISVFTRDKYTCVFCGQLGGTLHADHIKPFSLFPELRLDLDNGRTLCKPCHTTTDSYLKGGATKYLKYD